MKETLNPSELLNKKFEVADNFGNVKRFQDLPPVIMKEKGKNGKKPYRKTNAKNRKRSQRSGQI